MAQESLRILYLSSWFPRTSNPLLGNFVLRHAEASARQHEVIFLHVSLTNEDKKSSKIERYTSEGVKVIHFMLRKPKSKLGRLWNIFAVLDTYNEIYKIICRVYGEPHLIHANILHPVGHIAKFLKRVHDIPYVLTEHWTGYLPESRGMIGPLKGFLLRRVSRGASSISTVTNNLAKHMRRRRIKGDYFVIPNVTNTGVFYPSIKDSVNDKLKFIHISSLVDHHKNISGILRVIKSLSNDDEKFEFEFVTDGNKEWLENKIKKLQIPEEYIKISGPCFPEEVADKLRESDASLLFSNYENLPCVIGESLACGVPVISTQVGGIAEHLNERLGLLIPPKDEKELKEAMLSFIQQRVVFDRDYLRQYAVSNFGMKQISEQLDTMYWKALEDI